MRAATLAAQGARQSSATDSFSSRPTIGLLKFTIPHTTGRWSGTDWRDNDPEVEPLVEIYQGMRDTYEYVGSPKPFHKWEDFVARSQPIPRAMADEDAISFRRKGFVDKALQKGYRLGFIASSDHISTHISYANIIARELTLEALKEAVMNRQTYASTDNIIVDLKFTAGGREYLMGDQFEAAGGVSIRGTLIGTDAIERIDIIESAEAIHSVYPGQKEYELNWDFEVAPDSARTLYVRVIQEDGNMAWASPVWINR